MIEILINYGGKLTNEKRYPPGVYAVADLPRGLAPYLVEAGLARWVEPDEGPETVEIEPIIDATDAAIRLADEHGIELALVKGSGVDGRVLKSDVEQYIEEG